MGVFTSETVLEVVWRARGFCEACGLPMGSETPAFHHRKSRKYGDHSAANTMWVHAGFRINCHNLHQGSIHQNPVRSHRLGHILYEHEDPRTVPVQTVRNLLELRS